MRPRSSEPRAWPNPAAPWLDATQFSPSMVTGRRPVGHVGNAGSGNVPGPGNNQRLFGGTKLQDHERIKAPSALTLQPLQSPSYGAQGVIPTRPSDFKQHCV